MHRHDHFQKTCTVVLSVLGIFYRSHEWRSSPHFFLCVLLLNLNSDLHWCKKSLQWFVYCFEMFIDLLDEPLMHSWNLFGRAGTFWKVYNYSMSSPWRQWLPQWFAGVRTGNGFVIVSRLRVTRYFVSHILLSFFQSAHDYIWLYYLFFRSFILLHVVRLVTFRGFLISLGSNQAFTFRPKTEPKDVIKPILAII